MCAAVFLLSVVAWSAFGRLDITTLARGRIIVDSRVKTIQSVTPGIVNAIHVQEGASVHAGDVLIELDATLERAELLKIEEALHAELQTEWVYGQALAQLFDIPHEQPGVDLSAEDLAFARQTLRFHRAEIDAQRAERAAQIERLRATLATARADADKYRALLPLLSRRASTFDDLATAGYVSKRDYEDALRASIEVEKSLAQSEARRGESAAALQVGIANDALYLAGLGRELREKSAEAIRKVAELRQEQTKAKERLRQRALVAPVDGTVQQLTLYTVGGVVAAADQLMIIVPERAGVIAQAEVENKDIGFVKVGQPVRLKVDAFPFTKYGTVRGHVSVVSADAVLNEDQQMRYPVFVALEETSLQLDERSAAITAGMTVTAELKTGDRYVFEYFLHPVLRGFREAFHER